MASRRWISRCHGGLAGKLIAPSPPLPPRPQLPFVAMETRGSPPTPQNHRIAPAVGALVRQAGGNSTLYMEFVDPMARRLRAGAATCGVFFHAEGANGSSRAPRLERNKQHNRHRDIIFEAFRDGDDEGEGACGSRATRLEQDKEEDGEIIVDTSHDGEGARGSRRVPRLEDKEDNAETIFDAFRDGDGEGEGSRGSSRATPLERNLFDLPRHAAAGIDLIDVSRRSPGQGDSLSLILLHHRGGMIGTAAGIRTDDVRAFAHRCCAELSPRGHSIVAATPPSHALLLPGQPPLFVTGNSSLASPLRRVGASGAGFTMGGSSEPPLPERDFSMGGSRCVLTGLAAWASCHQPDPMRRGIRMAPHLYQQRRSMTFGRGRFQPHYGPFCKNGRTILKRPAFLPRQAPDHNAAIKHWKFEDNVDGVVYNSCLDATSLLVKFNPLVYLRAHNIIEAVPILGESNGSLFWKITEEGKYTMKSLIDLVGTFHDMGSCIGGLSIDSLVINSAGKFELIEDKVEFLVLTKEGVKHNYKSAVSVLKELIVKSMGHDMLEKVPEDILHLFDLMESDGYEYRYWIQTHVSLMPLQNRSAVFLAFFEYITLTIPKVDIKLKGKATKYIPYRKLWAIIASSNTYLVEWLKFQDETGAKTVWGSQYQLLYTVRNVIAHKLSLLESGMVYEAEEVDNMLHALFPKLLVGLQKFFWKEKRLTKFHLEAFFMDRKLTEAWPKSESSKYS